MATIKCIICQKEYSTNRRWQKYCSYTCYTVSRRSKSSGIKRKFTQSHIDHLTESLRQRSYEFQTGGRNHSWTGNKVSYNALHTWIRKNKPKLPFCEECNENPPTEVANISQKYLRDINDFRWLCRRCHCRFDNHLKKLRKIRKDQQNGQQTIESWCEVRSQKYL